jgi:hypothetical protein
MPAARRDIVKSIIVFLILKVIQRFTPHNRKNQLSLEENWFLNSFKTLFVS